MTIATDGELRRAYYSNANFPEDCSIKGRRNVYDLGVAHGREDLTEAAREAQAVAIKRFDECAMWRSRAERLQKERDALVTGAFTAQNVLTPERLQAARQAYDLYWETMLDRRGALIMALKAVGFHGCEDLESGDQREPKP